MHEAGHALLGLLLPEADPVQKVTIVPRGQALGLTYQVPSGDHVNYSEPYLRARIAGALGARAAEALVFGAVSAGAENDLQQATRIARQMVTRWGMRPKVGLLYAALLERESLDTAEVHRIAGLPLPEASSRSARGEREQPEHPIGMAADAPLPAAP